MIRSALLLCAALLAALTFACQQIPPGQPLVGRFGPIPFTSRPCSASDLGNPSDSTDLGSFASNVIMLASNFVPATLGSPPVNSPPDQVPSQVQMDLKAAFRAAPDDFRTALCGLTAVYIDPTNIYSWGYRDPT